MPPRIFITGFSSFGEVENNPTEVLIKRLETLAVPSGSDDTALNFRPPPVPRNDGGESSLLELPSDPAYTISGTKVLKVAAEKCRHYLNDDLFKRAEFSTQDIGGPIIVVHLGVDEKSTVLKLERCGYNDASFRIPDKDGWQPSSAKIVDSEPWERQRTTDLHVDHIAELLSQHEVVVSEDAGRYICNWTYYLSLVECAKRQERSADHVEMHALFVHVPPFECVAEDAQFKFITDLLQRLAECVGGQLEAQQSGVSAACL